MWIKYPYIDMFPLFLLRCSLFNDIHTSKTTICTNECLYSVRICVDHFIFIFIYINMYSHVCELKTESSRYSSITGKQSIK